MATRPGSFAIARNAATLRGAKSPHKTKQGRWYVLVLARRRQIVALWWLVVLGVQPVVAMGLTTDDKSTLMALATAGGVASVLGSVVLIVAIARAHREEANNARMRRNRASQFYNMQILFVTACVPAVTQHAGPHVHTVAGRWLSVANVIAGLGAAIGMWQDPAEYPQPGASVRQMCVVYAGLACWDLTSRCCVRVCLG